MIVRKGTEKEMKMRLNNYRKTRDSIVAQEESRARYYEEKRKRAKKNEKALLFYMDTLKATFTPKQFEVLLPVFDSWKKRHYGREAVLAHNDIRRELVKMVPKDELEEKLNMCQEKLRVRIEELKIDEDE